MDSVEEKIKIIDEIVKRHPSYGIENGWSYYTGGMADTGDWYFRKMLDEPIGTLKSFLDELTSEENMPRKESEFTQEQLHERFLTELERRLLFGK